ncbi:MAG: hypothetical protein AB7O98_11925 [Hyphomonadaceae bacterium]
MRVALIGNSHAAAYKAAWDEIGGDYAGLDVVFFASPASSMRLMTVENGAIVPKRDDIRQAFSWTSGGLDRIPGDMDAYILVGMSFSFPHLAAILRTHRPFDAYQAGGGHELVSNAVFEETMRQTLKRSGAAKNIDNVRAISQAPIFYTPNPYSARTVLDHPDYAYWRCEATCARIFAFYRGALAELRRTCTVVEQPAETISQPYFTIPDFARDAPKLRQGAAATYGETDHGHMNAAFGALSLRNILDNHVLKAKALA